MTRMWSRWCHRWYTRISGPEKSSPFHVVVPARFSNHHFNIAGVTPAMSSCSSCTSRAPRLSTETLVHFVEEMGLKGSRPARCRAWRARSRCSRRVSSTSIMVILPSGYAPGRAQAADDAVEHEAADGPVSSCSGAGSSSVSQSSIVQATAAARAREVSSRGRGPPARARETGVLVAILAVRSATISACTMCPPWPLSTPREKSRWGAMRASMRLMVSPMTCSRCSSAWGSASPSRAALIRATAAAAYSDGRSPKVA
ncbi:hypothetical protein BJF80_04735 [Serinicoccus sp. CUA-874]|nr:hypothetical protein BJF80_04735 [Serinicoccus sp. CUA-874]